MKKIKYTLGECMVPQGCVLALGFFDGVHLGHRELLKFTSEEAARRGIPSAVFTFSYGGGIKSGIQPIYSEEERELLLSSLGIEILIEADFASIKDVSPERFIKQSLLCDLRTEVAVVGYNYRFGAKGAGDASLLQQIMTECGAKARVFDEFTYDGVTVSSTRIRALLTEGNVKTAGRLLGLPYFLSGKIEHGRKDGTRFGYPTINVPARKGAVEIRKGVYLTAVKLGEKLYTGLTNVGECPSFGKREYHTETFLTDFSGDAYGMETKVYFLRFLRDELYFSSPDELGEQIKKDCAQAQMLKGELKWQELGQSLL